MGHPGSGSASPPPPPPLAEELGGSVDGAVVDEACGQGSRHVDGSGDPRMGILESSDQVKGCLHPCGKDIPQHSTEDTIKSEDGVSSLPRTCTPLQSEASDLTLCCALDTVLAGNSNGTDPLACGKENSSTGLQSRPDENRMSDAAPLGLDLNIVNSSDAAELNPFFPYKNLGQSKVSGPSECGSTTGATGGTESYRKWEEMKKNGFLSSSHGAAVVPKPRGRPPKRKRDDEPKRSNFTQNEQTKFMKVAAPSGLLSGLNPGIINHVRNSKQVYSIIKAMVRSEKLENASQPVFACQTGERGKEVSERIQDQNMGSLMKCHFMMDGNNTMFHRGLPTTSKYLPEDGRNMKLQLSSTVTVASDRTCSMSADDLESKQDCMTMLSVKAAGVAFQWLELLQQDFRGRLAALKRSRKRVRNALQTELPYLISTEFPENEACTAQSSEAGSTGNKVSEAHVARWRSLFVQMDRTLQEEGRDLENRLKEVQAMLSNCDKGLQHMTCDAPSLGPGPIAELWKLKSPEISESEWAVQAAAASIYSTCNVVMKTGNVPCF